MTVAELAYTAGFFDGEGCVIILANKKQRMKSPSYDLRVCIDQVDPKPLRCIQKLFGGSLRFRNRQTGRSQFTLTFDGGKAAVFLKHIQPYLIVKVGQVALALEFSSLKHKPGQVGRGGLPEDVLALYEAYKQEISRLKHVDFD